MRYRQTFLFILATTSLLAIMLLLSNCAPQIPQPSTAPGSLATPSVQPATQPTTPPPLLPSQSMSAQDNVPAPFRCYLDGVAAKDLDATTACFADDALVIDVGRRIEGKNAIHRWLNNEVMGLKYEVESVTPKQGGTVVIVRISFGSGGSFRARYDIDFNNNRIIKMDLQYA